MVDSLIPGFIEDLLRRFPFTFTVVELGVELELDQLAVNNLMRLDCTDWIELAVKNDDIGLNSIGTFAFYRTLKGQL